MRSIAASFLVALIGCSSAEQPPAEAHSSTSPALTEAEVQRIARAEALDVFAAAKRDANKQADQQAPADATFAQAERLQEAANVAESILAAKSRRENGYLLLTASERQRVDEIRALLHEQGLGGFSNRHADLRWGWYGEGRDALEADLLNAVKSPPAAWLDAAELFGLEGASLLDFWCDDLLESVGRIALAQDLRSGRELTEEMIRLGRVDPLVRPVLLERLKNSE